MSPDCLTFEHLRVGHGGATLAVMWDAGRTLAKVGVAFCSPKDQYSKKRGRAIAFGRLATMRRYSFSFPVRSGEGAPSIGSQARAVFRERIAPATDAELPTWVRDGWMVWRAVLDLEAELLFVGRRAGKPKDPEPAPPTT